MIEFIFCDIIKSHLGAAVSWIWIRVRSLIQSRHLNYSKPKRDSENYHSIIDVDGNSSGNDFV
jgi:hypothetical protein